MNSYELELQLIGVSSETYEEFKLRKQKEGLMAIACLEKIQADEANYWLN